MPIATVEIMRLAAVCLKVLLVNALNLVREHVLLIQTARRMKYVVNQNVL